MPTGVRWLRGVNMDNRRLIGTNVEGRQVTYWIVGEIYHFNESCT